MLFYFVGLLELVLSARLLVKVFCGVAMCVALGKIFVVGHDACHDSFTPSKCLNHVVAMSSLVIAFHVPSAWKFWHNVVHHAHTNDLSRDFVWRPLSPQEYRIASAWRRGCERFYRHHSGAGLGAYYCYEILLSKMLVVPRYHRSRAKWNDLRGVFGFYLFHIAVLLWLATGHSFITMKFDISLAITDLTLGFLSPLIYLCYMIGFVVYFNHTHPEIKWTTSTPSRNFAERQALTTVNLEFRGISEFLLPSEVMGHVAHHLDTKIPARKLRKAQNQLVRDALVPFKTEVWSWATQCRIMKTCKLYEPYEQKWLRFEDCRLRDGSSL